MTLTRFFYINSNKTKVLCYHKFCTYPKKTKEYKELIKISKLDNYIVGIGYEYTIASKGLTVTHKKLK